MQPFIDRFTHCDDPVNNATFEGIFGGPGWKHRLDKTLPHSEATTARLTKVTTAIGLFTHGLRAVGPFRHVVATPIEKDEGEASFRIVYGTRSDRGLEAYRDAEYDARRNQDERRAEARKRRNEQDGIMDMFADHTGPSR